MANFLKPPGIDLGGYNKKLNRQTIGVNHYATVALWGGGAAGEKLNVVLNDPSVAQVDEQAPQRDLRIFRVIGTRPGNAMLEARAASGAVWAFMQIGISPPPIGTYIVPDMKLIPQKQNMGCWFASAQMVIQWKREIARATLAANPDPSQIATTVGWEISNTGVTNPQVIQMARELGLHSIPPVTPTLPDVDHWLRRYGPLWTNGKSHIVVIAGLDQGKGRVLVFDPWPPGKGKVEWRPFGWYLNSPRPDSRDTSDAVEAVFLYHP